MTEYEILKQVPTGLNVAVYKDGMEILKLNVPAEQCKTRGMLEAFLKQVGKRKLKNQNIPQDVLDITGRQELRGV